MAGRDDLRRRRLDALPIVVYTQTGSTLGTSVAFLAELAPGVLLAPLAGRLADRVDRRAPGGVRDRTAQRAAERVRARRARARDECGGPGESGGQAIGMLGAGVLTGPLGLALTLDRQGALYLAAGGLALVLLAGPSRALRPSLTETSA